MANCSLSELVNMNRGELKIAIRELNKPKNITDMSYYHTIDHMLDIEEILEMNTKAGHVFSAKNICFLIDAYEAYDSENSEVCRSCLLSFFDGVTPDAILSLDPSLLRIYHLVRWEYMFHTYNVADSLPNAAARIFQLKMREQILLRAPGFADATCIEIGDCPMLTCASCHYQLFLPSTDKKIDEACHTASKISFKRVAKISSYIKNDH